MTGTDETRFEPKLGRIRHRGDGKRAKSYLLRVVRAMSRAGPGPSQSFGSRRARYLSRTFARRVVVKARIVKLDAGGAAAQRLHLRYIERDAVGQNGEKGKLFDRTKDEADGKAFLERGANDRHQFRLIVSPEDGAEMHDLKAFARDFVGAMESDLETRLDWVAAAHYDTAHPHVHLVIGGKRDAPDRRGRRDLVIPRKYISCVMRERASELVTIELGPQTELEVRRKLGSEVVQERFTRLDRQIADKATDNILDLRGDEDRQKWRRRLHLARLKKLERLGLAERAGRLQWRFANNWRQTLTRLGERGDIIKTLNAKLTERGLHRAVAADSVFDPADAGAKPIVGRVLATGAADEIHDRAYAIIDAADGRAVYVDLGAGSETALKRDQIVRVAPAKTAPKPADETIAKIASANKGRYSPAAHLQREEGARAEFVEAHVRRLEALRRAGHVERFSDGSWAVPPDYLERTEQYERDRAKNAPVRTQVLSSLPLDQQVRAIGATWLDRQLAEGADKKLGDAGFGAEARAACAARRTFLLREGFISENAANKRLPMSVLRALERRDLKEAAEPLSRELRKPYAELDQRGRVEGVYACAIDRPSGRYAVIERAKDFTLAPWREVLERNRGSPVSGIIRGKSISWTLTKGRRLGL